MNKELITFLENQEELKSLDLNKLIQKPKLESQGDFSLPMFILAKQLNKNPAEISKNLEIKLQNNLPEFLERVQAIGPFLNFYLNSKKEAENVLKSIINESIFNIKNKTPQKILIEYPSPNTNKSLHIGHARNILLGNALCKILEKTNNKVIKTSMNNNKGIAICKSMLAYKIFGNNSTPESMNLKPDEFVSYWYVLYGTKNKENPELNLDEKAQKMLVEWESGKKDVIKLWEKLQTWVFQGYKETFKNYKLKNFDKEYFESDIYKEGKFIITNALNKKIKGFEKEEDGAICYNFNDKTYGKKYLLRGDGTSLYMTQDLYLASLKEKDFTPDRSIFVVGKEQKYHFEVLFKILDKLGFGGVNKNYHFAYGYVYDKDGNKFSSRLGNTLGADEILNLIIKKAKENLLSKEISKNLNKKEIEKRAKIIGFAALSFTFLKVNPLDDMKFDLEKSLSFEGETGPYIQYTYARIQSILRKAEFDNNFNINFNLFEKQEISLIKLLKKYPNIIQEAAEKYKLSSIANYLIKICQLFNEFYQNINILKSEEKQKQARLVLIYLTAKIIKDALEIFLIEVLDEM